MKALAHIACILIFFIILGCSKENDNIAPQPQIKTISTFGGSKNESAQSIVNTTDGGYAVFGFTQSNDHDITDKNDESYDYWLAKFNVDNSLQWSKTYGGSGDDRGSGVIQTTDGGFAILGYTQSIDGDISENAGLKDYWLAKLDTSGNIQWQKSFGFSGADSGLSIIQTSDSGYLLVGTLDVTASGGEGNSRHSLHAGGDYWAIKLDALGNLEWSRYYGGSFTETPYDVIESENGYIIVGSSDSDDVDISNNKGTYDFWIVKIDWNGNLLWEKSFGGEEIDEAHAIAPSSDGNFWVSGITYSSDQDVSNNLGLADLWLIKISENGELLDEKVFGGTGFDNGHSIKKTLDNGFLICGSSRSINGNLTNNHGQNDAWIFKITQSTSIEWSFTIGGSEIDTFFDVAQLNDDSIVVVGETTSSDIDIIENKGFNDILIVTLK